MAEYIKREDALGCVLGVFDRQRIKELPAADVEEVKHGKWIQEQIKIENMSIVRYRNTCSECGGRLIFYYENCIIAIVPTVALRWIWRISYGKQRLDQC